MDQELESFVGLLNKNRARPVPDDLVHLPNWAQRALTSIPETIAPRRATLPHGAPAEPKLKSAIAVERPTPAVPTETTPPWVRKEDPLAAIIRELEARIEPPAERAKPAGRQAPSAPLVPTTSSAFDQAIATLLKQEPPSAPTVPEKIEHAPAAVEKPVSVEAIETVPALSDLRPAPVASEPQAETKTGEARKRPTRSVAAILELPDLSSAPPLFGKMPTKAVAFPEIKRHVAPPIRRRPVAYVAATVAVIAAVTFVASSYWYGNQAGSSLARNGMSVARNAMSLAGDTMSQARTIMAMMPPMPATFKTIAKAGSLFDGDKAAPDGVSALAPAAHAQSDKLAAATPVPAAAADPRLEKKVADAIALAAKPASAKPAAMVEVRPSAKEPPLQQIAMLPGVMPPPVTSAPTKATATAEEPTWRRNAVPAPPYSGRPQVAIVIDDLGIDANRTQRAIALEGPVTLSFLAYASDLPQQTEAARKAGHELIVHVPMEPIVRPKFVSAGSATGQAHDELLRRLRWDLSRFTGYVGVNNHMGNRLAADPESTQTVVAELKARGLLFLDYHGANGGVVAVAERFGVPTVSRDIFLDDDVGATSVNERLAALEKLARVQGTAIAIGHPHDRTLEALRTWLASLQSKGLQLVPLTAIVKDREQHVAGAN
jgi:hypothetical protein